MGMDVYGKNPTGETGKYFRNNVWYWRPLATYVQKVAPDICCKCKHWQSNDGNGLNSTDSIRLADRLQAEIDSGRTQAYAIKYKSDQEIIPDEKCDLCDGTGIRKPIPGRGAGDTLTGIKCNACEGKGTRKPLSTWYSFDVENVTEFVAFLRECGGFEIC